MEGNEILLRIFIGGAIGAIIGLEREKSMELSKENSPIGLRTDILIGLLGGSSLLISEIIDPIIFIITFIAVLGYSFLPLTKNSHNGEKLMSYKTAISSVMVFLLSALAYIGQFKVAITLAIITTFILSIKYSIKTILYGFSYDEFIEAIKFVIIAFIILPFLPNQAYDQSLISFLDPGANLSNLSTDIINPYRIWLLIVIISGLNFMGYILVKLFGRNKAYSITGLIGGFYSSTVTSLNLSTISKTNTDIIYPFVAGIFLACGTSFFKMFVLIKTLNTELFNSLFLPMAGMCIYLLLAGTAFHFYGEKIHNKNQKKREQKELIEVKSPLNIIKAFKLAIFVLLTMLAANLILMYANVNLYYILAGLMAFFAVDDPVIISTADIAGKSISMEIARTIILSVIFLNFLQKIATAYFFGNKKMLKPMTLGFSGLLLVTIFTLLYF